MDFIKKVNRNKNKVLNEAISIEGSNDKEISLINQIEDNTFNPEIGFMSLVEYEELYEKIIKVLTNFEECVFNLKLQNFDYKEISNILDKEPKKVSITKASGTQPKGDIPADLKKAFSEKRLTTFFEKKVGEWKGFENVRMAGSEELAPEYLVKFAVIPYIQLSLSKSLNTLEVDYIDDADKAGLLLNREDLIKAIKEYLYPSVSGLMLPVYAFPFCRYASAEDISEFISLLRKVKVNKTNHKSSIPVIKCANLGLMLSDTDEASVHLRQWGMREEYNDLRKNKPGALFIDTSAKAQVSQKKTEEAKPAGKTKKAEGTKKAEEAKKAEETKEAKAAKKAEEARKAEEERIAEEARIAEEEKRAAEAKKRAEVLKKAAETKKARAEKKKAEEEKKAEEAKAAEESMTAEEVRKAEEERKAEEARQEAIKKAELELLEAKKKRELAEKVKQERVEKLTLELRNKEYEYDVLKKNIETLENIIGWDDKCKSLEDQKNKYITDQLSIKRSALEIEAAKNKNERIKEQNDIINSEQERKFTAMSTLSGLGLFAIGEKKRQKGIISDAEYKISLAQSKIEEAEKNYLSEKEKINSKIRTEETWIRKEADIKFAMPPEPFLPESIVKEFEKELINESSFSDGQKVILKRMDIDKLYTASKMVEIFPEFEGKYPFEIESEIRRFRDRIIAKKDIKGNIYFYKEFNSVREYNMSILRNKLSEEKTKLDSAAKEIKSLKKRLASYE